METEKRLIDVIRYAEELRLIIVKERQRLRNIPVMQEVIDLLEIARNMALKQPTVNAVEVVRCKDCKHWVRIDAHSGDCKHRRFALVGISAPQMYDCEFCALGEMKAND